MRTLAKAMFLVSALLSTPVSARNIQLLSAQDDAETRAVVLADADSASVVSGYQRVWTYSGLHLKGNPTVLVSELWSVDCQQGRYEVLSSSMYDRTGDYKSDGATHTWQFVNPSSNMGSMLDMVCGRKDTLSNLGALASPMAFIAKFLAREN